MRVVARLQLITYLCTVAIRTKIVRLLLLKTCRIVVYLYLKFNAMNRDLDAKIVEHIFGWRYIPVSSDANGENACEVLYPPNKDADQSFYSTLPLVGKPHIGVAAPRYSSDLKTAIGLCKHIGMPLSIEKMPTDPEILANLAYEWWASKNKTNQ